MTNWFVYAKKADFQEIGKRFGIDPVTARIIRNRDIIGEEAIDRYLNGTIAQLCDPLLLTDAEKAAELLLSAIKRRDPIRVLGDYDIDGVCATYILYDALKRFGAQVDYDIPERIRDGYGLQRRMIEDACADGVELIITCDNGITAIEEIAYAAQLGMRVIVTDHHQPLYREENGRRIYQLPETDAVIDPHRAGDPYPYKEICGAVVAWKLMQVLGARLQKDGGTDVLTRYLPFAAFATVGDVMELREENRIIVKWGLKEMEGTDNTGLRALIRETGLEGRTLSAYHIGFVLGPCINATGRLDTARRALRLFTTEDPREASETARQLCALNEERKEMTRASVEEASRLLAAEGRLWDKVYVLYLPDCHESIAGIVAGKIRERYNHPVFVLTRSNEHGVLKGSGRSIESYPMYDAIVAAESLLERYGGHAMAAGISIRQENLEAFRNALNEGCPLTEADFIQKKMIDVPMPIGYIREELIEELSCLEPCGKGNERPLFADKNLQVRTCRLLGKNRNVLKLLLESADGRRIEGVMFAQSEELLPLYDRLRTLPQGKTVQILYYPEISEYQGIRTVQAVIREIKH